jgi:hypothetical protein
VQLGGCSALGFNIAYRAATHTAYGVSGNGASAYVDGGCRATPFSVSGGLLGPAIGPDGNLYVLSGSATVSMTSLSDDGGAIVPRWTEPLGSGRATGLAFDLAGNAIALVDASVDGGVDTQQVLYRIDPGGAAQRLGSYAAGSSSSWAESGPVVAANGDMYFCGSDFTEHRVKSDGSDGGTLPGVPGGCLAVVLVQPDSSGVAMYQVGNGEPVLALDAQGNVVWNSQVYADTAPVIGPGPVGRLPRLYVGSQDGHQSEIVVDTGLDPSSPWPRVRHDSQNTWDARAPLP